MGVIGGNVDLVIMVVGKKMARENGDIGLTTFSVSSSRANGLFFLKGNGDVGLPAFWCSEKAAGHFWKQHGGGGGFQGGT